MVCEILLWLVFGVISFYHILYVNLSHLEKRYFLLSIEYKLLNLIRFGFFAITGIFLLIIVLSTAREGVAKFLKIYKGGIEQKRLGTTSLYIIHESY